MAWLENESEFLYLEVEDIIAIYAEIFGCTDQEAMDQLRSRPGVEGALHRPRMYAHYQQADLALQAAALAHGLAEGQCFVEGNKRVALVALRTFLLINGYALAASQVQLATWIMRLSEGETIEDLATQIRAALVPAE